MFVFWPTSRHQCSPLPIDEIWTKKDISHSPDKAGFDIRYSKTKVSQCPVCKNKYAYGQETEYTLDFISYDDFYKDKA